MPHRNIQILDKNALFVSEQRTIECQKDYNCLIKIYINEGPQLTQGPQHNPGTTAHPKKWTTTDPKKWTTAHPKKWTTVQQKSVPPPYLCSVSDHSELGTPQPKLAAIPSTDINASVHYTFPPISLTLSKFILSKFLFETVKYHLLSRIVTILSSII